MSGAASGRGGRRSQATFIGDASGTTAILAGAGGIVARITCRVDLGELPHEAGLVRLDARVHRV